eukprot:Phypoly_transcript_03549.p1 GENE.Phypoly_transcript_03549~~Phypoly_transcript_03549.p1  ORF type:complete len:537 (-),score=106.48 Phypoly_transcript_03549:711-2321(-)
MFLRSSKGGAGLAPISSVSDNMNSEFMNFGDDPSQTPSLTVAPPSPTISRTRTPPLRASTPPPASPPSARSRLKGSSPSPSSPPLSSQSSPNPSPSSPISTSPTALSPTSPAITQQFRSQHGPLLRAFSDNVPQHGALLRTASDNVALGKARRSSLSPKTSASDLFELVAQEGGALSKYVFIKILFSWNDKPGAVYKVRKFTLDCTVEQAVAEINAALSDDHKSERNKLYFNGQPLESGKVLSSFGFQISDILHFKRDPQYEFSAENPKQGGTLALDPNMVIQDIIKKMLVWILGSIPANSEQASRGYSNASRFKLFKKLQAPSGSSSQKGWGIRLMDMKRLGDYGIKKRDVLQLVVKMDNVNSTEAEAPDAEADGEGEGELKKGECIYEICVVDAPIITDVAIEEEKEPADEDTKSKHKRVPSLLRKTSEANLSNLVGTPYNVVHKSHVNFDYQWSGDAVAEAFEYKEKIGQGGYGSVFRAVHKETGFTLAIKALANVNSVGLQKEIDILKKCRCGNVLSYYGSMVVKNEIWLVS